MCPLISPYCSTKTEMSDRPNSSWQSNLWTPNGPICPPPPYPSYGQMQMAAGGPVQTPHASHLAVPASPSTPTHRGGNWTAQPRDPRTPLMSMDGMVPVSGDRDAEGLTMDQQYSVGHDYASTSTAGTFQAPTASLLSSFMEPQTSSAPAANHEAVPIQRAPPVQSVAPTPNNLLNPATLLLDMEQFKSYLENKTPQERAYIMQQHRNAFHLRTKRQMCADAHRYREEKKQWEDARAIFLAEKEAWIQDRNALLQEKDAILQKYNAKQQAFSELQDAYDQHDTELIIRDVYIHQMEERLEELRARNKALRSRLPITPPRRSPVSPPQPQMTPASPTPPPITSPAPSSPDSHPFSPTSPDLQGPDTPPLRDDE